MLAFDALSFDDQDCSVFLEFRMGYDLVVFHERTRELLPCGLQWRNS
jgi:hypothetical protein